ncbi:Glutathione S-transferase [Capsicum baccatum]|uniref:glutathione transferase n=1 Tax=Capsicum baccatum TaxID=33114 RepID=A0A2G2VHZ5_CAPBA|nr:Glutathione S-transferase [Capsicum baccatum]
MDNPAKGFQDKRYEPGDSVEDQMEVFEGDLGVDLFDEEDEDEVLDEWFAKVAKDGDLSPRQQRKGFKKKKTHERKQSWDADSLKIGFLNSIYQESVMLILVYNLGSCSFNTIQLTEDMILDRKVSRSRIRIDRQNEEKLKKVLDVYEKRLGESQYLAGDEFTLADLSHFPNTQYLVNGTDRAELFTSRENVGRWWGEISSRESWKKDVFLDCTISLLAWSEFFDGAHLHRHEHTRCGCHTLNMTEWAIKLCIWSLSLGFDISPIPAQSSSSDHWVDSWIIVTSDSGPVDGRLLQSELQIPV